MAAPEREYDTVLGQIRQWSTAQRLALIHDVLHTLAGENDGDDRRLTGPRQRRGTLQKAIGLAAGDRPPPTDEEVKQWTEEWRIEKYG